MNNCININDFKNYLQYHSVGVPLVRLLHQHKLRVGNVQLQLHAVLLGWSRSPFALLRRHHLLSRWNLQPGLRLIFLLKDKILGTFQPVQDRHQAHIVQQDRKLGQIFAPATVNLCLHLTIAGITYDRL